MTAVIEDLDLSWATFTDECGGESCDGRHGKPCGLEAVVRAAWKRTCPCAKDFLLFCAGHRDELLAQVAIGGRRFLCSECESPVELVAMEPIR